MRVVLVTAMLIAIVPAMGQDRKDSDASAYKVELNIRGGGEGGNAKGDRRYTLLLEGNSKGTFRAGDRVPYATGSVKPNDGSGAVTTQYQYADVGVNIDARLREMGDKVFFNADIDLSTLAQHEKPAGSNPTISSVRVSVGTLMPIGKRTIVASIDDTVSSRRLDIEAMVSRAN